MARYSDYELETIRKAINGSLVVNPVLGRMAERNQNTPSYMKPFSRLSVVDRALYEKISKDRIVKQNGALSFFPKFYDMAHNNETPQVSYKQGRRGTIALVRHPKSKFVIKPVQSEKESYIAKVASNLGVGPRQYETIDGFLTEELVEGKFISDINLANATSEEMMSHGERLAEMLNRLHEKNVCYNDFFMSDLEEPNERQTVSHIIVPQIILKKNGKHEQRPSVLFDYGFSIDASNHPKYTKDELLHFMANCPNLDFNEIVKRHSKDEIMSQSEELMRGYPKKLLMHRDTQYFNMFLNDWHEKNPDHEEKIGSFEKGFEIAYREPA